jgi:hypothetical protein
MRRILIILLAILLLAQAAAAADKQAPKITVGKIAASDTEAKIDWKTNEVSTSVIIIGDKTQKFESLQEFSTTVNSLEKATRYDFEITACDASINCANYKGYFTTSSDAEPAESSITGAIISADFVNEAKSVFMVVIFGLIAVIVLGVIVRTGFNAISSQNPAEGQIKSALKNAESLISTGKKDEAFFHYNTARAFYSKLDAMQQAKYYDRVMATYSILLQHKNAKDAGILADKYISGNITKEELEKLRDLLG